MINIISHDFRVRHTLGTEISKKNTYFGPALSHIHLRSSFLVNFCKNFTRSWIRLIFPHILVHSDFHPYGIHFKICATWVKIWGHQNVRKSHVDTTVRKASCYFSINNTFNRNLCQKSKKCAIWVEIWGHHDVRKNKADPAVSKFLSYFSSNTTFEAILLQNQANMAQNHCYFANYVPLYVQSRRY